MLTPAPSRRTTRATVPWAWRRTRLLRRIWCRHRPQLSATRRVQALTQVLDDGVAAQPPADQSVVGRGRTGPVPGTAAEAGGAHIAVDYRPAVRLRALNAGGEDLTEVRERALWLPASRLRMLHLVLPVAFTSRLRLSGGGNQPGQALRQLRDKAREHAERACPGEGTVNTRVPIPPARPVPPQRPPASRTRRQNPAAAAVCAAARCVSDGRGP